MKDLNKLHKKHQAEKLAKDLYNKGYSTREVGAMIKRSHAWVANTIRKLSTENLTVK